MGDGFVITGGTNGDYVDGPVLEKEFKSYVGMHEIPIVHGLTVGELAKMIIGERWIENSQRLKLTIIKTATKATS